MTSLASLAFTVSLGLAVAGAAFRLTLGLFDPVCFTSRWWPHDMVGRDLAAGVRLDEVDRVTLCVDEPAPWQHALDFLSDGPTAATQIGALLLLLTLVRDAARHGIHTAGTAAGVRRLGHYLLWVLPTAALVEAIAETTLVHAAVTFDAGWASFFGAWDLPGWAVVTGIALLSLAKIMRTSAEMREDLEGIV
ncbi:MAG: hypothetical protein HOV94_43935 [Saccharothrix sp.]|nr:hypothetical protein [Saccharothrix sp.]